MSLWGKNDNKLSDGTVTVNHANRTVTGSGTTFGGVGCGATGDIIRFGEPLGGSAGYFGEAVIVGIADTDSIVINSTAGLTPADITGVNYQITQSPKSSSIDAAFNKFSRGISENSLRLDTTLDGNVAVGATVITTTDATTGAGIVVGDSVEIHHGKNNPRFGYSEVYAVGTNTVTVKNGLPSVNSVFKTDGAQYAVGVATVNVQFAPGRAILDGEAAGAILDDIEVGDTFTAGTNSRAITAVNNMSINNVPTKRLVLAGNLTQQIDANALGATVIIKRGAITGSRMVVRSKEDVLGDETQVLGVSTAGVGAATSTAFETGAGWVGVTTYIQTDSDGNKYLRVKKEVLVAMSGIQTGNTPVYDGDPFA